MRRDGYGGDGTRKEGVKNRCNSKWGVSTSR